MAAPRCLVFGGTGAVGGEVCRRLAARGARVAFTYHAQETAAMELASTLPEALALPLDLGSVPDVERVVEQVGEAFGSIDAFVQCAGVAVTEDGGETDARHSMSRVDEDGWDRMIDINAKSTFFAARRVAAIMASNGGGNLVFLGSVDTVKMAPAPVHYAASKGALFGMAAAMAKELGDRDIRVNMVAPGLLEAGLSRSVPEDLRAEYIKHCGLKRLGRLAEVAGLVVWLAVENTYLTGQTILLDGAL